MDADLDTFVTALYVTIDDALRMRPELRQRRPRVGLAPRISDAELSTLAVLQALLGFTSETRFLRHAVVHLKAWFPYIPHQSGYNKRLRKAQGQLRAVIRLLARNTEHFDDDTWVIDSTPVECGRSRPTALRSDLAGWASYGYCASRSRWFWGLRLHLVCTPAGLLITFALGQPQNRRARGGEGSLRGRAHVVASRTARPRRQGLPVGRIRVLLGSTRRHPRPTRPQKRSGPHDQPIAQALAPAHRIGQRHPQDPARSRTSRGQNPRWGRHPRPPAPPRPHGGHLAQLEHGPTTAAISRRVRSRLTP